MEYDKITTHVVHRATVTLDTLVYLLEKFVRDSVDFAQHLLATVLFAQAEFVVLRRHVEGLFEDAQVGQCGQIANAQLGGHNCLIIYANEGHEVFHSSYAPAFFAIGFFLLK